MLPENRDQQGLLQIQSLTAHQRMRPFIIRLLPRGRRHDHIGKAPQAVHSHAQIEWLEHPVDVDTVGDRRPIQVGLTRRLQQTVLEKLERRVFDLPWRIGVRRQILWRRLSDARHRLISHSMSGIASALSSTSGT